MPKRKRSTSAYASAPERYSVQRARLAFSPQPFNATMESADVQTPRSQSHSRCFDCWGVRAQSHADASNKSSHGPIGDFLPVPCRAKTLAAARCRRILFGIGAVRTGCGIKNDSLGFDHKLAEARALSAARNAPGWPGSVPRSNTLQSRSY